MAGEKTKMVDLPNTKAAQNRVGAIFYFFLNLVIDIVFIGYLYNTLIVPLFSDTALILYTALLLIFIATKTGIVTILIALGGQQKPTIKYKAIAYFIMNILIDWFIIQVVYGYFIIELYTTNEAALYGILVLFLILIKTGVVSIFLLLQE